jgi:hypothetical protein
MSARKATGRAWAYVGAGLGGAVSIAANVAHSFVPPAGAGAGWRPEPGAVLGAVFWPVALFVVVEIVARVAWPAGRRWLALRYVGLLPVAVVAAVVSYRHLSGLLAHYGEDPLTATIGPLAVDGLMVMASGALIASAGRAAAVEPASAPASPTAPAPAADPPAPRTAGRTGTRRPARTGKAAGTRTGSRRPVRTDAELTAVLVDLPRQPDGTVPIRRATAALGCGPDRARRLLAAADLLRPSTSPTAGRPAESAEPIAA